jgi:dihydropteroate synthase
MHAQGEPATMQDDPRYEDVVLDVYDALQARAAEAIAAGISPEKILLDPGIGFGKKQPHNLAILRRLSLFHTLGFPILLGASRKRFIGDISDEPIAQERVGGSLSVALHGVAQGVQVLRVHDTKETSHAVRLSEKI